MVVATYQSVSGAGKEAMDELFSQTRAVFVSDPVEPKKFPKRIAFNLIPQIDVFMDDGSTKEEWKMVAETKKILDPKIKLTATCVRVPVFIGHSEAVNIEFEKPISAEEARRILREAPGCLVIDRREPGGYITPHEAAGEDATYISRIREDPTVENGLNLWCVSDNLQEGRGPERGADRRSAGQPRLAEAQGEGGVRRTVRSGLILRRGKSATATAVVATASRNLLWSQSAYIRVPREPPFGDPWRLSPISAFSPPRASSSSAWRRSWRWSASSSSFSTSRSRSPSPPIRASTGSSSAFWRSARCSPSARSSGSSARSTGSTR